LVSGRPLHGRSRRGKKAQDLKVKICSDEVECGSLSAPSTSLAGGIGAESEPWLFQNAIIAPGLL
jgi:hypothetical protein